VLRVPVEARRKKATAARHKARGVLATWSGEGGGCDVCDVAQTGVVKSAMRRLEQGIKCKQSVAKKYK
jgi:hypothetical protein